MGTTTSSRETIRSADRTLAVLDAVAAHPEGVSAAELAASLDLSSATTYRLLGTLQEHDYLVRTADSRYILGRAVDDLGRAVRAQLVATPEARSLLAGMRDAARAPAYLTVFRGDDIAVAHVADSVRYPRITQLHVGFAESAHITAFGKIMLAQKDAAALTRYLDRHGARALTSRTVTDEATLRAELDDVRALQIAVEVEEYMPKLACIAAPVRDRAGRTVGAVSVSTSADDFARRAHELERIVRRGAWHVASATHA